MRYIVKKVPYIKKVDETEVKETEYEFTHIWEQENINGEMIEVVKGRNILTKEKLEKVLSDLDEQIEQAKLDIETIENNKKDVSNMLDAINSCKE